MKKIIFLVFALMILSFASQAQYSPKWATYFGNDSTKITSIKYDSVNNKVYIAGYTSATSDIATTGAHQTQLNVINGTFSYYKTDLFLAQFDTAGNRIWSTYYGGNKDERGGYISIDKWGNVFLSGTTYSEFGIATPNSFMEQKHYASDFLVKFNSSGQRIWGTYYGSITTQSSSTASGIPRTVCDSEGNIYMAYSGTTDNNIATPGSHRSQFYGNGTIYDQTDGYLVKFTNSGTRLWGTYLGGYGQDLVEGLSIDNNNNLYVTGITNSFTDIATAGTYMPSVVDSFNFKGYIMKFNSNGVRAWGTYIGGNSTFVISSVVDDLGNIYLQGTTFNDSNIIATPGTHQVNMQGQSDIILLKLNSQGQRVWGTYFGGENLEGYYFFDLQNQNSISSGLLTHSKQELILLKEKNTLLFSGATSSNTNVAFECPYDGKGAKKSFVTSLNTNNGKINWSSYHDAHITDLSYDYKKREIYMSGWTNVDSIATNGTFKPNKTLNKFSGFFTKIKEEVFCKEDTVSITQNNSYLTSSPGYINYKWYRNDTLVHTSINNTFLLNATPPGNYYVIATTECGCIYKSAIVYIEAGVSINSLVNNYNLQLSPNPTKNNIRIIGKSKEAQEWHYQIYSIFGQKQLEGSFKVNGKFEQIINTENLIPGSYYLKISNNKQTGNLKFIKI